MRSLATTGAGGAAAKEVGDGGVEEDLERKLAAWRDEAEPIATTAVDHALLAGGPAEEIARFAREGRYDVIAMGTRGQTGREGWGLGSVAQSVVREAPCTVVVVRGRISRAPEHRSSA